MAWLAWMEITLDAGRQTLPLRVKKTPGTNVSFSLCYRNLIHASDAIETANKEIALWFKGEELIAWTPCATPFLYE